MTVSSISFMVKFVPILFLCALGNAASMPESPNEGSSPQICEATLGSEPLPPELATIPEDTVQLEALSEKEKFQFTTAFNSMFVKVVSQLSANLEVDDLKLFLEGLTHPDTKLSYIDAASYEHCSSTKEILRSLRPRYIYIFHLDLLKGIIALSENKEAKSFLSQYESTIPYSMPLSQLDNPLTEEDIKACHSAARILVVVDGDPNSFSLQDIEGIKSTLQRSTGVSRVVIVFSKYQTGSIVLTFLVPNNTVEHFLRIGTDDAKLATLANTGIVRIEVGEHVINLPNVQRTENRDSVVAHITLQEAGGMFTSPPLYQPAVRPELPELVLPVATSPQARDPSKEWPGLLIPMKPLSSTDSGYGSRASSQVSTHSGYSSRASSLMSVESGYGSRASSLMSVGGSRASSLMDSESTQSERPHRVQVHPYIFTLAEELRQNLTGPSAR